MKNTRKLLYSVLSLAGVATLMTPIITACTSSNLKRVDRGDGSVFAKYGDNNILTFKDEEIEALMNESGNSAFKTQLVNQLLYNWYEKLANDDHHSEFSENWKKWDEDIKKDYDNQVQNLKNEHGSDWEYYLQNNVLDPEGGTEESWKYNQKCKKVRDAFADLAFQHDYLAYSAQEHSKTNVDSPINTFDKAAYDDVSTWKNVDFYAHANTNYSSSNETYLDDIYALIQKEAFEQWSHKTHPISVAMSLWKFNDLDSTDIRSIYSKKVPDNNDSSKSTVNDSGESTSKLKPAYETPAFDPYNYEKFNTTGKYKELIHYILSDKTNYGLGTQGVAQFGGKDTKNFTDDSSNSMIVTSDDAFSSLDSYFAGVVAQALGQMRSGQTHINEAAYIKYPVDKLLPTSDSDTDILYPFLYRSNDDRYTTISDLERQLSVNRSYVLDLAGFDHLGTPATFLESQGHHIQTSSNFHSAIFQQNSIFKQDYYGDNVKASQGGVQFVASGVQLMTTNNKKLPYFLIRDTFGIHLVAVNGIGIEGKKGFLSADAGENNLNTAAYSQERQNIMLKAQALYQRDVTKESGIQINSKIKDFFKNNTDDVILAMAKQEIKRPRDAKKSDATAIFDWKKFYSVNGAENPNLTAIYSYLDAYNKFVNYKKSVTNINTANKKLFDDKLKNVKNTLIDRSDANVSTTQNKYKNALAAPYPFDFVAGNVKTTQDQPTQLSTAGYEVTSLAGWTAKTSYTGYNASSADIWNGSTDYNDSFAKLSQYKNELRTSISDTLLKDKEAFDKGYISNDGSMSYSEHIYNKWDNKLPLNNGVYKALSSYAGTTESTTNIVKLWAMKEYAKDLYNSSALDPNTGLITAFKNDTDNTLMNAVIQKYYVSKVFDSSNPISLYSNGNSINADNNDLSDYLNFVSNAFIQQRYLSIGANGKSDDELNYWKFIDALYYLTKNNYEKLMEHLAKVIGPENEADLVWLVQDNTDLNRSFNDAGATIDKAFKWKANFNGLYDNTYMPGSYYDQSQNNKPSTYMDNTTFYNVAPIPYLSGSTTMYANKSFGFAGLNTESDTNSAIPSGVKDKIFSETYSSKGKVSGTGSERNVTHTGVWYKFGSVDDLYKYINDRTKEGSDIDNVISSLSKNNKDPKFTRNVVDIAQRKYFAEGDPEINKDNREKVARWKNFPNSDRWDVGYPIPNEIRADRLEGKDTSKTGSVENDEVYKIYKDQGATLSSGSHEGWGLESYKNLITTDKFDQLFTRFGTGKGAELIYNDIDENSTHLIPAATGESSSPSQKAIAAVIQLNHKDVTDTKDESGKVTKKAYDNLFTALGGSSNDTDANKTAKTLIDLIAVQYAMSSTLQTSAENDLETNTIKDKITVFDRRWNDALGSTWVKDWKATN